ncbi:NAD(P)/FAD-dependent oxidoreductase [Sulfolobus tengchongensis]|uniref:NAD(P)/FAD-dependent oxidoreductase n=1 Tax=Sulfolobus tengchongensis TaxID=207809 RepID=A0AAX4L043_9CREN
MNMPVVLSKKHRRPRSFKDCEPGLPYTEIINNGKRINLCNFNYHKKYVKIGIPFENDILHNKVLRKFPKLVKFYSRHIINLPNTIEAESKNKEVEFINVQNLIIGSGTAGLGVLSEIDRKERTILISSDVESNTNIEYPLPQINKDEFSKLLKNIIKENQDRILEGILLGKFDEGIGFLTKNKILVIRANKIFLTTGSRYIPPLFEGNDTPGLISKNLYLRHMKNEEDIVTIGNSDDILKILSNLKKRRILITNGILFLSKYYRELMNELGIEIIKTSDLKIHRERNKLRITTEEYEFYSNIAIYAIVKQPKIDHSSNIGVPYSFDNYYHIYMPNHNIQGKFNENVYLAGGMRGISDEYTSFISGRATLNEKYLDELIYNLREYTYIYNYYYQKDNNKRNPSPYIYGNNGYVCECEDVTLKEIMKQVKRGFNKVEHIKRTTGLGTGECQGKFCTYSLGSFLNDNQLITFRTPLYRLVI